MADLFTGKLAQITPFTFNDSAIRVVMREGEPWFLAVDICKALKYQNTSKAIADHLDADEQSNVSLDSGGRPALIINESGLYALVLRSQKPEARKFAKWVTSEVIPSIRKTGWYSENSSCKPTFKALAAARKFAHTFLDASENKKSCRLDEIPQEVVLGVLGDMLLHQRFLMSFDPMTGHMSLNEVPRDAYILSEKELAEVVMDKTRISGKAVFDIAQACHERIKGMLKNEIF